MLCSQIPLALTENNPGLFISFPIDTVSQKMRHVSVMRSSSSWDSLIILLSDILILLALCALPKSAYKTNVTCTVYAQNMHKFSPYMFRQSTSAVIREFPLQLIKQCFRNCPLYAAITLSHTHTLNFQAKRTINML
jgi:hypothetical protein